MSKIIMLDSGPLGLISHPQVTSLNLGYFNWINSLLAKGYSVNIPEIADYEVRRELLRSKKFKGIQKLNELHDIFTYVPIDTATMLKAAEFWAAARQAGLPTADIQALDGDVILAAQATMVAITKNVEVVVATTNVKHLSRFVNAHLWSEIS